MFDQDDPVPFDLESVKRMNRDLAKAAMTMSDTEARYLVDSYYIMQEDRKRANNQARSAEAEPNSVIQWLASNSTTLENQIKRALDIYTKNHPMGEWLRQVKGIGPVLAAGLLAHIDITKAPTTGRIWRYAGLDPTAIWPSAADSAKWVKDNGLNIELAARTFGRNPENLRRLATTDSKGKEVKLTATTLAKALSRRPWNTTLKTTCWKIGQSFRYLSSDQECFYGQIYRQRKLQEIDRNDCGDNAQAAAKALPRIGSSTEAYKWLSGCYPAGTTRELLEIPSAQRLAWLKKRELEPGKGVQMLPPDQLDARARRYAVKLFLSHFHDEYYRRHYGKEPPFPYAISVLGHQGMIPSPV